jgi:hypothetical protein
MCISCEGRIPLDAEVCPFCATHQMVQNSFQAPIFQNQSLEDSLTSLYTPPYQGKQPQFHTTPQEEPMRENAMNTDPPHYKAVSGRQIMDPLMGATVEDEKEKPKGSIWPILLLLAGVNFSIIGLMQLFFSKDGVLTLEWNANWWFFYCLIGIPLLYFGFKKAKDFSD